MSIRVFHAVTARQILVTVLTCAILGGCSGRPYFCQAYLIPPDEDYIDGDWSRAATVCDTRVSRDLFTSMSGALLTITIEDPNGQVLTKREVLYLGEERLDYSGSWLSESTFQVTVFEESDIAEEDRTDAPIGEFVLSVP